MNWTRFQNVTHSPCLKQHSTILHHPSPSQVFFMIQAQKTLLYQVVKITIIKVIKIFNNPNFNLFTHLRIKY